MKMESAIARFGSSLRAGVPVFERERRTERPKEPVSGTNLRLRVLCCGSTLEMRLGLWSNSKLQSFSHGKLWSSSWRNMASGWRERWRDSVPSEDHGVWSLDSILANVQLLVRDVVQNKRRHAWRVLSVISKYRSARVMRRGDKEMHMMRPKRGRRVVLDFDCVDELRDFCGSNNISGATVRDGACAKRIRC